MPRRISYRLSLTLAIPLLVAVTGAAVIWYAQARARRQVETATAALFDRVSRQAGHEAQAHLLRAGPVAELISRLLDEDPAIDRPALARRFVAFLRANPELSWVTYSTEDGAFTDIKDFTTMAEALEPRALVELLGGYLDEVLRIVAAHYGTVDKFLGDGVMAFWGAPTRTHEHAVLACECAVRIQRRLLALGGKLQTRIGLATGEVLVGNIGSHERMNYTVMGDTVNLASRLEALNKQYATSIMISESTAKAAARRIVARPVDIVAVKGKQVAVLAYEILGLPSDGDPATVELARASTDGFERYLARDFAGAVAAFEAALAVRPGDPVSTRLVERARGFLAEPPPPDWTGVFHATEK